MYGKFGLVPITAFTCITGISQRVFQESMHKKRGSFANSTNETFPLNISWPKKVIINKYKQNGETKIREMTCVKWLVLKSMSMCTTHCSVYAYSWKYLRVTILNVCDIVDNRISTIALIFFPNCRTHAHWLENNLTPWDWEKGVPSRTRICKKSMGAIMTTLWSIFLWKQNTRYLNYYI